MELFVLILILLSLVFVIRKSNSPQFSLNIKEFEPSWKVFLYEEVKFYRLLDTNEKTNFENRVLQFINTTKITGIGTRVEMNDRLLVAASAIIPIFYFPEWEYRNLYEVLLYPKPFNTNYQMNMEDSSILGMVGTGVMEGKMILSKPALVHGFGIENDKKNVGIHEFAHLVDKADGAIDGMPKILMDKHHLLPWIELVKQKMEDIHSLESDINPYGGVSDTEFFSVITEYFFERPKLLQQKHPELYSLLAEIYTVDLAKKHKGQKAVKREIRRNDPCICGSREKFKHCCGKLAG